MPKEILENVVLKRWAKRCGQKCGAEWNNSIGKLGGLKAAEQRSDFFKLEIGAELPG